MDSTADGTRILHLGSDPGDSALLEAELEAESILCRVTHVSTQAELRAALTLEDVVLVIADLPLPWDGATRNWPSCSALAPSCG